MRSFFSMCSALVAMKVWMRRIAAPERLGGTRDVAVVGARQRAHRVESLMCVGNRLDRLEVAVRRGREAGLDHVHAQALELPRDAQLLVLVIEAPGDCSPSRKVVSKMMSLSAMVAPGKTNGPGGIALPRAVRPTVAAENEQT